MPTDGIYFRLPLVKQADPNNTRRQHRSWAVRENKWWHCAVYGHTSLLLGFIKTIFFLRFVQNCFLISINIYHVFWSHMIEEASLKDSLTDKPLNSHNWSISAVRKSIIYIEIKRWYLLSRLQSWYKIKLLYNFSESYVFVWPVNLIIFQTSNQQGQELKSSTHFSD